MVDRRRLPDGLQCLGGKLPDHLADPEGPIVVQQTTHRNRQRDREHVMRPELQHDAARAPHRLRPPIAFKVSQQPMMDTAASIAGYND
jgi:hypothetical protein